MYKYNIQFEITTSISIADMKSIVESGYDCVITGATNGFLVKVLNHKTESLFLEKDLIEMGKKIFPNPILRTVGSAVNLNNYSIGRTFIG